MPTNKSPAPSSSKLETAIQPQGSYACKSCGYKWIIARDPRTDACPACGMPPAEAAPKPAESERKVVWLVELFVNEKSDGWWTGVPKDCGGWRTQNAWAARQFTESEAKAVAAALDYFPSPFRWSHWIATEHVFFGREYSHSVTESEREAKSPTEPTNPVSHLLGKYLNTMVSDLRIDGKGQYLRDLFSKYESELRATSSPERQTKT